MYSVMKIAYLLDHPVHAVSVDPKYEIIVELYNFAVFTEFTADDQSRLKKSTSGVGILRYRRRL
jgi:hypothetical protein